MDVNFNHPSFLKFIENSVLSISENIDISNYTNISNFKKRGVEYLVYQSVINSFSYKVQLSDEERLKIIDLLMLHNEKKENYILALIFKNMKDKISDFKNVKKKRTIKNKKPVE